ncbi:hypothetical protein ACIQCD_28305 [Streptomyces sp. NPDC093250]|uniref:arsenate reductase/protein-tyrosine-phosphatase family protein n=1 Tax=Streptomyces sp. NPDC093250 TaxID=3366036 RepID=UPI0038083B5B
MQRTVARTAARCRGTFGRETVERYLAECVELLAARSRVTAYVIPLAQHFATERLDAIARNSAPSAKGVPEVLFVCTENAGRSQLAAALFRDRLPAEAVCIRSAGTHPATASIRSRSA